MIQEIIIENEKLKVTQGKQNISDVQVEDNAPQIKLNEKVIQKKIQRIDERPNLWEHFELTWILS